MRKTATLFFLLSVFSAFIAFASSSPVSPPSSPSPSAETPYPKLRAFIDATPFIDVHSHPAAGHRAYDPRDSYPTLEPPIGRPYWPVRPERIAVFDSLEPQALRAIYGYKGESVRAEDIPAIEALSKEFWSAGKKNGLNRVLDIAGIERIFANTDAPPRDLDPALVSWVAFVDHMFYPFGGAKLKNISPYLRAILDDSSRGVAVESVKFGIKFNDLASYLTYVRAVLADDKKNGAVAVKVGSAYFRTLWFGDVDEDEAAALFASGLAGALTRWEDYKKLQDFIARAVFLEAGRLNLPVHVHTGFGADAGLRSLDSNPLNLESVLSDIRFKDTRFVMLHAGYPQWDKLKPLLEKRNAFVDFSAVNWMVYPRELAVILYDWLSYPGASEKIMFGSDAGAPVFFWIAARVSRDALYLALSRLIDEGIISEDKAVLIAEKLMRGNALRIH